MHTTYTVTEPFPITELGELVSSPLYARCKLYRRFERHWRLDTSTQSYEILTDESGRVAVIECDALPCPIGRLIFAHYNLVGHVQGRPRRIGYWRSKPDKSPSFGPVDVLESLTEFEETVVRSIQLLRTTVGGHSGTVPLEALNTAIGRGVGPALQRLAKKGVVTLTSRDVQLRPGF